MSGTLWLGKKASQGIRSSGSGPFGHIRRDQRLQRLMDSAASRARPRRPRLGGAYQTAFAGARPSQSRKTRAKNDDVGPGNLDP